MIEAVGVVVPAHDEAELLPACLAGLAEAAAMATKDRPGLRVRVVVAADACTDGTVAVARQAGVPVVPLAARNVGRARAAGLRTLLQPEGPAGDGEPPPSPDSPSPDSPSPDSLWLATTDADSVVPARWLSAQLQQAEAGWDAVVGTVTVADWTGYADHTVREFGRRYGTWQGWHPHVHGANLGFTAAAYRAVGGFPALPTGEDRALVASLQAGGFRVLRSAAVPVITSARVRPRAPAGFGHDLATLNDGPGPLLGLRGGAAGV